MRTLFAMFVFLAFVGCKSQPPKVVILGQDTITFGSYQEYKVEVTPIENVKKIRWSLVSDQPEGYVRLEPETGEKTTLSVSADALKGEIRLRVEVIYGGELSVKVEKLVKIVEPEKKKEPLWPTPIPPNFKVLNDYENPGEPLINLWGGRFGTWGFKNGKCTLTVEKGVLRLVYNLPMLDSSCGTYEYLAMKKNKYMPVDIRDYKKIVFLARSEDSLEHKVRFEIVEYDPYAAFDQGIVADSEPITVGIEWQRYEIDLDKIIPDLFKREQTKQIGFRIDRKEQSQGIGAVLFDNLTFVKP